MVSGFGASDLLAGSVLKHLSDYPRHALFPVSVRSLSLVSSPPGVGIWNRMNRRALIIETGFRGDKHSL